MSIWECVLLLSIAGATTALQPSINARLAERIGSFGSSFISFAVGTAVLFAIVLIEGKTPWTQLRNVPWWQWTGGCLGAFYVTAMLVSVPRIGTAATLSISIAASLLSGLWLDQIGAFGVHAEPITMVRLLGVLLLIAGAALVIHR